MVVRLNPYTTLDLDNTVLTISQRIKGTDVDKFKQAGFSVGRISNNHYRIIVSAYLNSTHFDDIVHQQGLIFTAIRAVKGTLNNKDQAHKLSAYDMCDDLPF